MSPLELWYLLHHAVKKPLIKNGVVRVGIYSREDTLYVCFPGTGEGAPSVFHAIAGWLINAVYKSYRGRHAGWYAQFLSIYIPLRRELAKRGFSSIVFTGYSQGGALAQLAGDAFASRYKVYVRTFASPRPFRLWVRPRCSGENFVCGGDLVTKLPPATTLYKSALRRVRIGRRWFLPSVRDHYPDRYEAALQELEGAK